MRKLLLAVSVATALAALPAMMATNSLGASPADEYSGPHFGADNLPPGCIRDMSMSNPDNVCYHMRTGLNGLDSPQVDVLVMVPVSPTAERDMRIMRQSVEMWEGGIDYLTGQMNLGWLGDGMDFHVTVDFVDPVAGGGEFTTYPIVDPEIVIIATNPVGGVGIGIDPMANAAPIVGGGEDLSACHGVRNPLDFSYWENLPGFDSHHGDRSGTYTEDCDGAGGNTCFAINGAIDPAPDVVDVFGLFDLVSHEFGHCLTIGHVGDGAEGSWGALPSNDIMAYSSDPPGGTKCVSTLDVEGIALRMSKYLDVNGDAAVDNADLLLANDPIGDGRNAFQVQHPHDHQFASGTGSPLDCPQPDLGAVPGPRTSWTPTPVDTSDAALTITSPADGAVSGDGAFNVTGTVEHAPPIGEPTERTGSMDYPDDDATTPITEIRALDVEATPTHVDATIHLADLWPSTVVAGPTTYSVLIDGRKFDSFIRYPNDPGPMTWDSGAAAYLPAGTSRWDLEAKAVSFHIPRDYLASANIASPYYVGSQASFGSLTALIVDDSAPDTGDGVGVAGANVVEVNFNNPGGNTFHSEESTLGVTPALGLDPSHLFSLHVPHTSDIEFSLTWTDAVGSTDLDLYVTGDATSNSQGATGANPESFVLHGARGDLDIRVIPFLVTDALAGSTYTLTATITNDGPDPDTDGDGVIDADDACPDLAGNGADGCPILATEHVHVYVDGALAASQDVDTANGPDAFDIPVTVGEGTHELRIEWEDRGKIVATRSLTVTHSSAG